MAVARGLDREGWHAKLHLLGESLQKKGQTLRLEIFGSWPLIDAGMPSRSTMDLDVWATAFEFDPEVLRSACESAGLEYNPFGEVTGPYLQIVRPGIVTLPEHTPEEVGRWGGLILYTPPLAAIAAAKLVRADPQDISDVFFIRAKADLSRADIAAYVERLPNSRHREAARENLVYLDVQG